MSCARARMSVYVRVDTSAYVCNAGGGNERVVPSGKSVLDISRERTDAFIYIANISTENRIPLKKYGGKCYQREDTITSTYIYNAFMMFDSLSNVA